MSHTVVVKTEVKDLPAIRAACERLKLSDPIEKHTASFGGQRHNGIGVQLREWSYPLIINPETGVISFDNYGGSWGDPARLDEFVQAYTIERSAAEARINGYTTQEEQLEDGTVRLQMQQFVG